MYIAYFRKLNKNTISITLSNQVACLTWWQLWTTPLLRTLPKLKSQELNVITIINGCTVNVWGSLTHNSRSSQASLTPRSAHAGNLLWSAILKQRFNRREAPFYPPMKTPTVVSHLVVILLVELRKELDFHSKDLCGLVAIIDNVNTVLHLRRDFLITTMPRCHFKNPTRPCKIK